MRHLNEWCPKRSRFAGCVGIIFSIGVSANAWAQSRPNAIDDRLTVELFASEPDIMTPTGIAVDNKGRVYVAESHTHFRPDDYDGPRTDRILILDDTDGDGKADKRSVFHEGFIHIMDIEFAPDGELFVATRMDIHRVLDTDGDDRADRAELVVKLETEGNYPHNGLSGLAFDFRGALHFGLGENLGKPYALHGTDGIRISGGGEGGSTYYIEADGSGLRRFSTGWWNPFGMCVDAFGRVFGTDNDPDSSPPCRLIQVVSGGNYGYEFRYGRSGLHPLTTWNGELPGTLPMISGTGEAPCAIISYESGAFPEEYWGQLFLASWADHRIERYELIQKESAGLVQASRHILIEGPDDFRPVDLAVAPDGSVFVSDWVSSSYSLHKLGRIWRVRPKGKLQQSMAKSPENSTSLDRAVRERAGKFASKSPDGMARLRELARINPNARVRATACQALIAARDADFDWLSVASKDRDPRVRASVVRARVELELDVTEVLATSQPQNVRAEVVGSLSFAKFPAEFLAAWNSKDPLVQHAVVEAVSNIDKEPAATYSELARDYPLLAVLAWQRNGTATKSVSATQLKGFTSSTDPRVQLAAVKWIADDVRRDCRDSLVQLMTNPKLDVRLFLATVAALDRLDDKPPTDRPSADALLERLRDERTPASLQRVILRLIDPAFAKLKIEDLARLLATDDGVALEAVRTMSQHPDLERMPALKAIALDESLHDDVRTAAVAGLSANADTLSDVLVKLASSEVASVRDEALRSLIGVKLDGSLIGQVETLAKHQPDVTEAVQRVLSGSPGPRPPTSDVVAWVKLVDLPGDPASGERVFFGSKVGTCSRCHQFQGRGSAIGPDLSRIHERSQIDSDIRTWLLKTVLVPGNQMAPQFTPWVIQLKDGRTLTGLPRRKGGNAEAYLGSDGNEFTVKKDEIESCHESKTSLMPQDVLNQLTRQEIADLLAFLGG